MLLGNIRQGMAKATNRPNPYLYRRCCRRTIGSAFRSSTLMMRMYLLRSTFSNIHRQWLYQNPFAGPYGSYDEQVISGNI